jgi:hypothetical protein
VAAIELGQVVQIVADRGVGSVRRRASGYLVTSSKVLTAGHAVAGAKTVTVIFNADLSSQWIAQGAVDFAQLGPADLAVLSITPPATSRVAPISFGKVPLRADVVRCTAVGFPRWKLRSASIDSVSGGLIEPYRDSHQADGTIAGLSNWRQGTFEIRVAPPPPEHDPRHSPWEGMSGAAVWSSGSIVGLVSEHRAGDGLGRLTGVRVERWYELLRTDQLQMLRHLIGLPDTAARLAVAASSARTDRADGRASIDTKTSRERLSMQSVARIVEQMLRADELRNPISLQHFLSLLPPEIQSTLPYVPQPQAQLINVIRRCHRAGSEGREALVNALSLVVPEPDLSDVLGVLDTAWPSGADEVP